MRCSRPMGGTKKMRVWVVTQESGDYDQSYKEVCAAFTSEAFAQGYATALEQRPGFPSESSPGSEYTYDVVEVDVWDTPASAPVVTFCLYAIVKRTGRVPRGRIYRQVEVVPVGTEGNLWKTVVTPEEREPEEASVYVVAPTEEAAKAAYQQAVAAWRQGSTDRDDQ